MKLLNEKALKSAQNALHDILMVDMNPSMGGRHISTKILTEKIIRAYFAEIPMEDAAIGNDVEGFSSPCITSSTINSDELQELGIAHGFLNSPTIITARNKIETALKAISDEGKIDAGIGFGEFDFWIKINHVEYFITIKPPKTKDSSNE